MAQTRSARRMMPTTSAGTQSKNTARPPASDLSVSGAGFIRSPAALSARREQRRHFLLHLFELIEPELRVGHDEDFTRLGVLENPGHRFALAPRLHFLEQLLALEHRSEEITRGGML